MPASEGPPPPPPPILFITVFPTGYRMPTLKGTPILFITICSLQDIEYQHHIRGNLYYLQIFYSTGYGMPASEVTPNSIYNLFFLYRI